MYDAAKSTAQGDLPDDAVVDESQLEQGVLDESPNPPEPSAPQSDSATVIEPVPITDQVQDTSDSTTEPERVKGERIASPRKVLRINSMLKRLLKELRAADPDQVSTPSIIKIYVSAFDEIRDCLSPDLQDEFDSLTTPFNPTLSNLDELSGPEIRLALAQVVGWLDGLLHAIQGALTSKNADGEKKKEELDPKERPGLYL